MDALYHAMILDLYKHPLHKEPLADFDIHHTENNPVCGDTVEIFLKLKNKTIKNIGWQGDGCAISQAAASLIADHVKGKTQSEIATITKEDVLDMLGLKNLNPTRLRCALLALEALKKSFA